MSADSGMTVQVPTELQVLGKLTQDFIASIRGGATMMTAVASALPTLFAEGVKLDEVKAEFKDPQAIVLAGIIVGQLVVSFMAQKTAAAKKPELAPAHQEHAAVAAH